MINELIAFLYERIKNESEKVRTRKPTTREGFELEKTLELAMAQFCHERKATTITIYPARYELDAPTFSGQRHQFDLMVQDGNHYIVAECKRRKGTSTRDQILTFCAKLIDYGLGFHVYKYESSIRGVFLSTAAVPDGSVVYALGMGVEPIAVNFPPIEYLLTVIKEGTPLRQKLLDIRKEIAVMWPGIMNAPRRDGHTILESYRNHYALWKEAVNSHGQLQESSNRS